MVTGQKAFKVLLDISGSLALVLLAVGVLLEIVWPRLAGVAPAAGPESTDVAGLETALGDHAIRHDGARVAIIEFSDFQCPYCGRYAREVYPRLKRDLVDRGLVDYSFRHLPLENIHEAALNASEGAECAGQQKQFWPMHDKLFSHQEQLTESALVTYASTLGLDGAVFRACLTGPVSQRIRDDQVEARRLGVRGTPTFLVGEILAVGKVRLMAKIVGTGTVAVFNDTVARVLRTIEESVIAAEPGARNLR